MKMSQINQSVESDETEVNIEDRNNSASENGEIHREHLLQTLSALHALPLLIPFANKYKEKPKVYLPPRKPHEIKTLLLDLDETMIHCLDDRDSPNEEPDVIIAIPMDGEGSVAEAGINVRPHLYECLRQVNQYY